MDFRDILDFFFPNHCLGCGTTQECGHVLCVSCECRLPIQKTFFCGSCQSPLAYREQSCHDTASYILGAAGSYAHPLLRSLVHHLKFEGIQEAALPLARLLIRYLEKNRFESGNALIVPIPLHPKRERTRGFNQAAIIARIVADYFKYEYSPDVLRRHRFAPPQSTLPHEHRANNILDSFSIADNLAIRDRSVIVIDDVVTSGATFKEAADVLRRHGARGVIALAVLRAQ